MFCTNCGKELKEDARFCENCGTKVEDISKPNNVQPIKLQKDPQINAKTVQNTDVSVKNKEKKSVVLKGCGIVLLVFAVCTVLIITLALLGDDTDVDTAESTIKETITKSSEDISDEIVTQEEITEEVKSGLSLGETYSIDGLEFTITDYEFVDTDEETMKYCIVYTTVKNTNSETVDFDGWFTTYDYYYTLQYKGIDYNCSWGYSDNYLQNNTTLVALGELKDKWIQFKVPNEVMENSDVPLTFTLAPNKTKRTERGIWNIR